MVKREEELETFVGWALKKLMTRGLFPEGHDLVRLSHEVSQEIIVEKLKSGDMYEKPTLHFL